MNTVFKIKKNYAAMLSCGVAQSEALEHIKNNYYGEFERENCEYLYWFTVAEIEVQSGMLCESTRETALSYCNGGYPGSERIKSIIESFTPSENAVLPADTVSEYGNTEFKKGDVFAYKSGGKFFAFRVAEIDEFYISDIMHELGKSSFAVAYPYDWHGDAAPDMQAVSSMQLKYADVCDSADSSKGHISRAPYIFYFDGSFNGSDNIIFVGNDDNYPAIEAMVLNSDYIDIAYEEFLPAFFEKVILRQHRTNNG